MSNHELVYRAVNKILLHFELCCKFALLHFRIFKEKEEGTHLLSARDGSFSAMRLAESFCNIIRLERAAVNRKNEKTEGLLWRIIKGNWSTQMEYGQ